MNKDFSGYDYVTESYKFVKQDSNIDFVTKGGVNSVGITSGGVNYKVNDRVIFDRNVPNSFDAQAKVTKLKGSISGISVSKESISGIKFYRDFGRTFVGIASTSLNLQNGVTVNIGGLSTTRSELVGSYEIGISSTKLILSQGIGTAGATGIVTFFNVDGNIGVIRPNDRFKVGLSTEIVKVLEVDILSSRIRVLRPVEAVGVSHTQSTILEEIPRVFTFSSGIETSFPVNEDREIYFNPANSIGTSHANPANETGIGNTITINNPGAGPTTRLIPRGSIFLPGHGLKTGDVVNYELNGVNGSETAPKVKFFSATPTVDSTVGIGTSLFVIRKTDNLIGLSTVKVGIGSTGVRFGLGLTGTLPTFEEIQFLDVGIGSIHSLRVKNRDKVSGSITRNVVTVVGTGTHGLTNNDTVFVDVNTGINTTITVKYNKVRRKAVFNPLDYVAAGIVTGAATGGIRDSININDHKLTTGTKVIHTSDDPIGLDNNKEYYVCLLYTSPSPRDEL